MSLPIESLVAFGLSPQAVAAWRAGGVQTLLPLQEKAVAEYGFLHGRNLLVFAPTSSGKTFVAEIAALKHLEQRRRVIYLVPTKALAEEKYQAFLELYGSQGYRVAIATRERPETDRLVLEGRYDLLVAVYEKMKAYLVARPEMLSSVAAVVADEIQTIGEPGRGATIDLLLTKITKAPYSTQFIGLSAVLGDDAGRLAKWLDCELLVYRQRPVELREGVFDSSSGLFRYQNFNTGDSGEEPIETHIADFDPFGADGDGESSDFQREAILELARVLAVERHEQALVFVPTRHMSRNWAHQLSQRVDLEPAREALDEIRLYEDTQSREWLEEALCHGIAFHNSDLSWDLRALIERHFNTGAIRVLVSTSTLGQGVNLKGRNVLHVPTMIETDRWTARHTIVALTRGRFRNQGGRGARFGCEEEHFGRSILVARNTPEAKRMARDYIGGEIESLTPRIDPESLDLHALDLIASRAARTRGELSEFLHDTFTGRTLWPANSAPAARSVEKTIASLLNNRLLVEPDDDDRLEASGLGEVAAATGLETRTVLRVAAWLREGPRLLCDDPIEALLILATTPDGRDFAAGNAGKFDSPETWVEPLRERLLWQSDGVAPAIEAILSPEGGFTRQSLSDFRKTLILDAWIGPGETREIEETFHILSGTAANLASHIAWIAQGAGALARALTLPDEDCRALDNLGERLVLGCAKAGLGFRFLRVQGFSRAYLQALLREGYASVADLAEVGEEGLASILPPAIARDLAAEARRRVGAKLEKSTPTPRSNIPAPASADPSPEKRVFLEIDLRGSGAVRLDGEKIRLPRLAFRLLTVLARTLQTGASYEEIQRYVWPDALVEQQQVHAHRRRLKEKIAETLGAERTENLFTIQPGVGLGLALRPEQVLIVEDETV